MDESILHKMIWYEHLTIRPPLQQSKQIFKFQLVLFSIFFRIGCAMKKSAAMKRNAANLTGRDAEAEIAYNKGRQAIVRMLGKNTLQNCFLVY